MKQRSYDFLADATVAVHAAWTVFVFGGAVLVVFVHGYALAQIIVLSVTLLSGVPFGMECPLTLLEKKLRRKNDPSFDNHDSFMTTYVNKFFETDFSVKKVNTVIAIFYIASYAYCVVALLR